MTPAAAAARPTSAPAVAMRSQLLDAAERCLHSSGIRRTTMVQVADEAGVSRAWLYRHFPDKASLLGAALLRQDEQFWVDARARISRRRSLAAQVAEAIAYSREKQPGALVLRLRETEPEAYAATVGVGLREAVPGMARFWLPYIEDAKVRGDVRSELDTARAAEWVIRVVLSLLTTPGDAVDVDDPASVRQFVGEFLIKGLG